jgi:hypothetical protein
VIDDLDDADAGFYKTNAPGDAFRALTISERRAKSQQRWEREIASLARSIVSMAMGWERTLKQLNIRYLERKQPPAQLEVVIDDRNGVYYKKPWFYQLFDSRYRYICTAAEETQLQQVVTLIREDLNMTGEIIL